MQGPSFLRKKLCREEMPGKECFMQIARSPTEPWIEIMASRIYLMASMWPVGKGVGRCGSVHRTETELRYHFIDYLLTMKLFQ